MRWALEFRDELERTQWLALMYPHLPTWALALVSGLSTCDIFDMSKRFGWRKSPEYMERELRRQGERLRRVGKSTRFQKGLVPHNKGKRMPKEVYERCAPTMFQPGNEPHNTRHDGALSRRRDKSGNAYTYIRMAKGVWELYHRVVWEREHGPIPHGWIVTFRDGNTANCSIDNLESISQAENARRNSMWNRYPEDVAKAIQLRGALKRRIRAMSDEQ